MYYGRIEIKNGIHTVTHVATFTDITGDMYRDGVLSYAIYPLTFNSHRIISDAFDIGDTVQLTSDGFDAISNSGVISPMLLNVVEESEDRRSANIRAYNSRVKRDELVTNITLPNVYRYLSDILVQLDAGGVVDVDSPMDAVMVQLDEIDDELGNV